MMELKQGSLFKDSKYGSELIIRRVSDAVVLASETNSGINRLYGREEFSENKNRFIPK